jgi:hypothetical protein
VKFSLRFLFIAITVIAVLLAGEFQWSRPYYELRGVAHASLPDLKIWIAFTWPAPGFDDRYCSQLSLGFMGWKKNFPADYRRGAK